VKRISLMDLSFAAESCDTGLRWSCGWNASAGCDLRLECSAGMCSLRVAGPLLLRSEMPGCGRSINGLAHCWSFEGRICTA
jgi:hypothetical protein